jgi:predicted ATPase
MALYAICGSQGEGKTTVLSSLAEIGYNIIPRKTSRLILNEWGCTLSEIHKDLHLTMQFQDEILIRHKLNNMEAVNSDKIYFTERSYADIFTYTIFALGSFNEYNDWLNGYYEKCRKEQGVYDAVIQLQGRIENIENDGVRSVNRHFSNSVNTILDYYIKDFNVPWLCIENANHDERIKIIEDYIK